MILNGGIARHGHTFCYGIFKENVHLKKFKKKKFHEIPW